MAEAVTRTFGGGDFLLTPAPPPKRTRPNRVTRRAELARAPRNIRVLARKHRTMYLFAHGAWGWRKYVTNEEYNGLPPDEQRALRRSVRNMMKRRRQQGLS